MEEAERDGKKGRKESHGWKKGERRFDTQYKLRKKRKGRKWKGKGESESRAGVERKGWEDKEQKERKEREEHRVKRKGKKGRKERKSGKKNSKETAHGKSFRFLSPGVTNYILTLVREDEK